MLPLRFRAAVVTAALLVTLFTASAQSASAQEPAPETQPTPIESQAPPATLKALLDQTGLSYEESGGAFRVAVTDGESEITVICGEQMLYEDDNGPVNLVWLFTPILSLSEGRYEKAPVNLLRRIAAMNDDLRPGSISMHEQSGKVFYNSSFWLSTATPTIMNDELSLAFYRLPALRDELLPYLQEE